MRLLDLCQSALEDIEEQFETSDFAQKLAVTNRLILPFM